MLELADEAVRLTDISLQSELETVVALDRAGARQSRRHGIVAMVDLSSRGGGPERPQRTPALLWRSRGRC